LRIINITSENCKFDLHIEDYHKTLEELFMTYLLQLRYIDFSPIKQFIEGPFLILKDGYLVLGLDVLDA
jgi:hypothetical protein